MLTLEISGKGAEALDGEAGGHRLQRVAPTDKRGRIHSSTVTVAVFGGDTAPRDSVHRKRAEDDFEIQWYSGSGAGGQHRNKHMNSARITHLPTGIVRTAQTRSRENSRMEAMKAINAELDRLDGMSSRTAQNVLRNRQVGTGERSDRRRMWAFQRDIVEDFHTGKQTRCADAMKGHIDRLWR